MFENKKRGMTLIETMIGLTMMVVVTGGALRMAQSTTKAIGTSTTVSDLNLRAQRALDEIGEVLRTASRAGLTPALPGVAPFTVEANSVTYTRVTGIDDATQTAIWGAPEQITFEYSPGDPADGVDNDGDGLVDDGRIVLIEDPGGPNPRRKIISNWVTEALEGEILGNGADDNGNGVSDESGLSFEVFERGVMVRLTLARQEPGGQIVTATVERSFAFRNSN
ncbi:MAG: type II secretory pathway pseudopilin PulG [Chlamydiales bacterium]|jgi:type II secretory pathway pseudopilin PulG